MCVYGESDRSDAGENIRERIREYYASTLTSSDDLKTNACCCSSEAPPRYVADVLREIDDEVLARFYGCGSPIPPALTGATVLDLGCGAGRDVFIAAKLAGASGRVIGIDMTPSQIAFARAHAPAQLDRLGIPRDRVEFIEGFIEDMPMIADASIDVVISNCVINLSPFKERLFQEIMRVLKPGGELYFSDVFSDRRVPPEFSDDPVLAGECIAGAFYLPDFTRIVRSCGVESFLVVDEHEMEVGDITLAAKLGCIGFKSCTIRVIKCADLEASEENYLQQATYLGTMPENKRYFDLCDEARLIKGRPVAVSSNMARMLAESRYAPYFEITAPREHVGPFSFARANDALRLQKRRGSITLDELFATCANVSIEPFEERVHDKELLESAAARTMQVNVGYRCNLACAHCFLACGPARTELMERETMEAVLAAFARGGYRTLDITGGAPEENPHLAWLIEEGAKLAEEVIVRSNLSILALDDYAHFAEVYRAQGVKIVASLPYFEKTGCDAQRGEGSFRAIVEQLRALNERGYGIDPSLRIDLVYNVNGPYLAPDQGELEDFYRYELERNEKVRFNGLYALGNYALGRFAAFLASRGKLEGYLKLLADNYNAAVVARIMCRTQVDVDWDGALYDCEANHVLGVPIEGDGEALPARALSVFDIVDKPLPKRRIKTSPICYTCAAGAGSSCGGSLMDKYAQAEASQP